MINYKYIDILNNKDKKTSILKIKINKYNKILNSLSDLIALFGLLIKKNLSIFNKLFYFKN